MYIFFIADERVLSSHTDFTAAIKFLLASDLASLLTLLLCAIFFVYLCSRLVTFCKIYIQNLLYHWHVFCVLITVEKCVDALYNCLVLALIANRAVQSARLTWRDLMAETDLISEIQFYFSCIFHSLQIYTALWCKI